MKKTTPCSPALSQLGLLVGILTLSACGGGDSDTPGDLVAGSDSTFVLDSDRYEVWEGTDTLTITVHRIDGSSGEVSVDYATQDLSATAGTDYAATLGTLRFPDGVASLGISVPILQDAAPEGPETFSLSLSNPTGGTVLGTPASAEVTILDDESVARYDFESLNEGAIDGQDNWVDDIDFDQAYASIVLDSAVNGTRVVRPSSGINGSAGQTELARVNDANFSFAPLTADTAEIWFDATGDDNAVFALGRDLDGDGMLHTDRDELGVPFGIWERQFAIFTANSLSVRAGVADLGPDDAATDWYRLRLRIDFAANGGEGAGSLAYMNLSNGESAFTEIPALQDVNLRLLFNAAPAPTDWNALFLLLRIDAGNIPKADNLLPNVPLTAP